jgi:hypothetical protein
MTSITLVQIGAKDAPIACTLTSDNYQDRTAALSDLAGRALIGRASIDGGQRLRFTDIRAIERELRSVVAAESSCCSFLSMDLRCEDEALVLDITGPADAQPIIEELFA